MTRDAREVDGLVDWLYPNSTAQTLEAGRYVLRFTALGAGGSVVDEDVTVRLYTRASAGAGGAIKVDVLFADDAVEPARSDGVGEALVARVATLYAQAGMSVADYTVATLHIGLSQLALDGGRLSAASLAMLQSAMRAAGARADAVHLVVVRGLDDGGDTIAGYSLGLPGPFAAERPTAAVLVSLAPFASAATGAIDTDGLGTTAAHEIGHYLGLYHTSERDGSEHDPVGDTPECADGEVACADAGNVMFWTGGGGRNKLTAGQGAVMRRHPLVSPRRRCRRCRRPTATGRATRATAASSSAGSRCARPRAIRDACRATADAVRRRTTARSSAAQIENRLAARVVLPVDHETALLDDEDAGFGEALGALVVADARLQPDGARALGEDVVDVRGHVAGAAEDVDDVDVAGHVGDATVDARAEDLGGVGIVDGHRDDLDAACVQRGRHVVRGLAATARRS